jgi:hypothetical protein
VALPIIAVLTMITVVGIPVALLGLMLYVVALFLAKIVVAYFIGRQLTGSSRERHFALTLALGLVLVIAVINLPFIGGVLSFVLTVAGLGLIVKFGWEQTAATNARRHEIA